MSISTDNPKQKTDTENKHRFFVKQYIHTRKKAQRIYSNDEVRTLPDVPASHVLFEEWLIRKRSAIKLLKYLGHKKRPLKILEVGCGNGWLSAALGGVRQSAVVGIDINDLELDQAKEVFHSVRNLEFLCCDLNDPRLRSHSFDIIVFAASLQYFASVNEIIKAATSLLSKDGEIHVLDTHFYGANDIEQAKSRTEAYYTALGF